MVTYLFRPFETEHLCQYLTLDTLTRTTVNTSKTPGLYQCGGVTNNDVGINFWGIVLIVKSNDYISQLLIGNVFAWRNLGDDGLTWGKFNIVTARTQ